MSLWDVHNVQTLYIVHRMKLYLNLNSTKTNVLQQITRKIEHSIIRVFKHEYELEKPEWWVITGDSILNKKKILFVFSKYYLLFTMIYSIQQKKSSYLSLPWF